MSIPAFHRPCLGCKFLQVGAYPRPFAAISALNQKATRYAEDRSRSKRLPSARATQDDFEAIAEPWLLDSINDSFQKPKYQLKGVSFGGCGIFFWWEMGCVLWILKHVDVDSCPFSGASGGALAATLTACKVDPLKAFDVANRLAQENNIYERPLGLAGVWGKLIRVWLDELLPENAADICRDRLSLIVTRFPRLHLTSISDFDSRDDLIDANLASCHIPFFLDGKMSAKFRDISCLDGSLHDFISGSNSDILTRRGVNLVIDYFDDIRVKSKRYDVVALKTPKEVLNMIHMGYEFADRLSKTEAFERALINSPKRRSFLENSSIPWRL